MAKFWYTMYICNVAIIHIMGIKIKAGLVAILLLTCILLVVLTSRHELRNLRKQQLATTTTEAPNSPYIAGLGACAIGSASGCMQTVLVSEYGKIETFSSKLDERTGLKLTSNTGKEYVFTDADSPFITYEHAVFNGSQGIDGLHAGFYLVSAANRGKDGFNTFDKIYEVWLGDKLEVKNIISDSGFAGSEFLETGNQVTFFKVNAQNELELVTYNLSDHAVEATDNFPTTLLKTNIPWYKKSAEKYYLVNVSTVPRGYVLSFSEEGVNKGAVTKMVFWEAKTERMVDLIK